MVELGLESRNVLVTGGTSGIGLAVADMFAGEKARVGILGRSAGRLDSALKKLRANHPEAKIVGYVGDVADEESMRNAISSIASDLGGLDHVVNSAGIAGPLGDTVDQVRAEDFLEIQRVNVLGAFLAAKLTLPYLIKGVDPTYTLVGSDSGFVTAPGMLAYNASKGAVVQLTRALSVELHEPHGIRVNSVCPSIVDTPMARDGMGVESFEGAEYPVSNPEQIAWLILSLASPKSVAVNGVSLLADYGYHARSSFPA
ncbi:SDR family oxidoreductase [Streptomyces chartreusis]|uniref:SDR family oxidoreductase n=2 Tax=Streptomyces chartreusis TaxID=1969 RepID=A0A7H8TR75_STRCX|nr:SDR family oxidoreductase [Streptomyces chartreusis]